jgi:hypothetical protein
MNKKIIGCLSIFFMAEVGMADEFLTDDGMKQMSTLAKLPGTTYCEIEVNPYDFDAFKKLLKTPGYIVQKYTSVGTDDNVYLVAHPNTTLLMGSLFHLGAEAGDGYGISCFNTQEDMTVSKRSCGVYEFAREDKDDYGFSDALKLTAEGEGELFFVFEVYEGWAEGDAGLYAIGIHSKKENDERLNSEKFGDCWDIETITKDK